MWLASAVGERSKFWKSSQEQKTFAVETRNCFLIGVLCWLVERERVLLLLNVKLINKFNSRWQNLWKTRKNIDETSKKLCLWQIKLPKLKFIDLSQHFASFLVSRSSFFFSDLISFRKNMKNIFIWWVFLLSSQIENFLLSENVNYGISLCHRQQWIFPSTEARGEIVLWKSKSRHWCLPQRKKLTFNWMWTAAKTRAPREIQTVHYIHRSVCTYCIGIYIYRA